METSIFIAKIFGLMYTVFGLGMLFNSKYIQKAYDEMLKSRGFMIYGGMMALLVGFLIVDVHNIWVKDWTVIITILGWIALLKGFLLIVAPEFLIDLSKPILKKMNSLGIFVLAFGLVLGYFGFVA